MAEAIVIGAVLKIDLRGWNQPPPELPKPPIRMEEGRDGMLTLYYDVSPPDHDMTAADFGNRIWSRLERMLVSEKSPFREGAFARRFTLEVGFMYDAADGRIATSWPADFLRILGDADAELIVTHYPFTEDGGEPRSEDDL
ncbi:MAG: hypothetical protein AB7F96_14045 [Beijerinckiaceae bacterium]